MLSFGVNMREQNNVFRRVFGVREANIEKRHSFSLLLYGLT
jgi:hypothetical protein